MEQLYPTRHPLLNQIQDVIHNLAVDKNIAFVWVPGTTKRWKTIKVLLDDCTMRYGETAYGTASKAVLRKLDPIHHRGVRFALGTFAVTKTR
jgi:hypothetical protein